MVDVPALGAIDAEAGEFWVNSPFSMPWLGHNLSAFERNRMFLNVGAGPFIDVSFLSGADIDSDSRAMIAADFDGDGAEDLLVANAGGGPLRLFHNQCPTDNARVIVRLVGAASNRLGIGSRIVAEVDGRRVVRDLFAPNGFAGQAPAEVFMGLGPAEKVASLSVRWPSGASQRFRNVPVNGRVTITENSPAFAFQPFPSARQP
jgi:hypothetical protein